jgi:hypothetical protein
MILDARHEAFREKRIEFVIPAAVRTDRVDVEKLQPVGQLPFPLVL